MTRGAAAAAIGILGIAAALRLAALGRGEVWHDECCSVLVTTAAEGVWKAAGTPGSGPDGGNPPLYYALLDAWTQLFGLSAPALRSLSLLLSVAHVALLGVLARTVGASGSAALATMALAAVAPVHVFYGTEARAYVLLLLLLTIALIFFFRALRSGRTRDWAAHGVALVLGWYAHNLALPFTAAFWVAAALAGAKRRDWIAMATAHAAAGVLYAPWIPVLLSQTQSGAHEWIRVFWKEGPPFLLVPRTLEAMFVGGKMPAYLSLPEVPGEIRFVATLALLAISIAVVSLVKPRAAKSSGGPPRGTIAAMLAFVFVPLLFLLAYSFVKRPLYLVGRYDLSAYPAFAVLAGIGIDWIVRLFPRARLQLAATAMAATLAILAFFSLRPYVLHPSPVPKPGTKAGRGELLVSNLRDGDVVVCTGFTTAETWYQLLLHESPAQVATYPIALRSHLGWYNPDDELARGEDALRTDAREVLGLAAPAATATGVGSPRLWLVAHTSPGRGAHGRLMDILFEEIETAGMRIEFPPGREEDAQRLGVAIVSAPPGAR